MKKAIWNPLLLIVFSFSGFLSGIGVMRYLDDVFYDTDVHYTVKEVFYAVFFSMNTECRDYLSLKNILLFRWLYLFFGLGIILFGSSYLTQPKSYHIYVFSRCNCVKTGLYYIFKDSVLDKIIYVFLYFTGMLGSVFVTDSSRFNEKFLPYLLLFGVGKILQLSVINTGMFLLYLKFNVSFSVLGGFIILTAMVLLDLLLPVSFVFFDSKVMFVDTILLNSVLLLICNVVKYKIKLEALY